MSQNTNAFYVEVPWRIKLVALANNLIHLQPIAVGTLVPPVNQSDCGIAIGQYAGQTNQGECAIAIGKQSGALNQSTRSIALGVQAGSVVQGQQSIAIGNLAGFATQASQAIAIGTYAGENLQNQNAIAIGYESGQNSQGSFAIAIGAFAGQTNQPEKSIILNASGTTFSATQPNALYINPIRNATAPQALFYDPSSKEISYSDPTFSGGLALQTYTYAYFQARDAVLGKFMYTDCADKDAFYRLRVSTPTTLFEGNTIYDSNQVFFDNDLTANATITGPGSDACMTLSVNTSSVVDQYAARQTHYYGHYEPGKSFMAMFSFSFGPAVAGIVKRVGLYDVDNDTDAKNNPKNGILLEQSSSGLAWKLYKGDGSVQTALQTNWNVDPLNGAGPSGYNLTSVQAEKNLLGFVDLEWLGVGRVRVGFFINGVPVIVNAFNNAGLSVPYINNPLLPIRYEVRKIAVNANSASMNAICCTILSEGGYDPIGIIRTFQSAQLTMSNVPSEQIKYILAIRLGPNYPRADLKPVSLEIVSNLTGGANIAYFSMFLWRPSSASVPSNTTWNNVSGTLGGSGSFVQYSNSGQSGAVDLYDQMVSDVSAGGLSILILEGAVNSTAKTQFLEVANSLINAQSSVDRDNRDIFLITINNNLSGNNKVYTALFTFREF